MGTKQNPGDFDCYREAHDDEPMFILLGRDPFGPALVRAWADLREQAGDDPAKIAEARKCADAMTDWLSRVGRHPAQNAIVPSLWTGPALAELKGKNDG